MSDANHKPTGTRGVAVRYFETGEALGRPLWEWAYVTPRFPKGIKRGDLSAEDEGTQQETMAVWFLTNYQPVSGPYGAYDIPQGHLRYFDGRQSVDLLRGEFRGLVPEGGIESTAALFAGFWEPKYPEVAPPLDSQASLAELSAALSAALPDFAAAVETLGPAHGQMGHNGPPEETGVISPEEKRARVVLWHGAGEAFCAGNDVDDFLKNPPGPEGSPQARLMNALINFDKPLIAAVHGAAIGGGTTMLTHCDFVYASESAKFQMPFINLALVPEFGSSWSVPARIGHIRAAELILLGLPFDAKRAVDLGLVTRVVSDLNLLMTATEPARALAAKPASALQACMRLLKRPFREPNKAAMKAEMAKFSVQVRSADAKEAFTAFPEKHAPDFTKTRKPVAATKSRCRRTDVRNAESISAFWPEM
jgi:enoyl-CoA hydratase/carnithine racemase